MNTRLLRYLYTFRVGSVPQKFYIIGFLLLLVAAILTSLGFLFFGSFVGPARIILIISMALLALGLISELTQIARYLWASTLGKVALGLATALLVNSALGLGGQVINSVAQVGPQKFGYTVGSLSILMVPFYAVLVTTTLYLVTAALFVLSIPFLAIYLGYYRRALQSTPAGIIYRYLFRPKKRHLWKTTWLARLSSAVFIMSFVYLVRTQLAEYETKVLHPFAAWHMYEFEMFTASRCDLAPNKKIVEISSDVVLRAERREDGIHFELGDCVLNPNRQLFKVPRILK